MLHHRKQNVHILSKCLALLGLLLLLLLLCVCFAFFSSYILLTHLMAVELPWLCVCAFVYIDLINIFLLDNWHFSGFSTQNLSFHMNFINKCVSLHFGHIIKPSFLPKIEILFRWIKFHSKNTNNRKTIPNCWLFY